MINRSKLDRFFIAIIAICLLLFGLSVFFDPIFISRKFGFQINFGEHHQLIGFATASIGGIFLYLLLGKNGE